MVVAELPAATSQRGRGQVVQEAKVDGPPGQATGSSALPSRIQLWGRFRRGLVRAGLLQRVNAPSRNSS